MAIVIFKDDNKNFMLFQNNVAAQLNPVLRNPLNSTSILKEVVLTAGANTINHLLGQPMQGWYLCDVNAPVQVYRSAPFNNLTLTLTSSGPAVCNIAVF